MFNDTPLQNLSKSFVRFNDRQDLLKLDQFQNHDELKVAIERNLDVYIKLIDTLVDNLNQMTTHVTALINDVNQRMNEKNELVQDLQTYHTVEHTHKIKRSVMHLDFDKFDDINRNELRSFIFACRIKLERNRDHFTDATKESVFRNMILYLNSRLSEFATDQILLLIEKDFSTHDITMINTLEDLYI
ncbi:MAG: hypothetical protein Q9191_008553 [Dirinaria sp. TL-2023a]